jgi:hypothetical protein
MLNGLRDHNLTCRSRQPKRWRDLPDFVYVKDCATLGMKNYLNAPVVEI